MSEEHYPDDWVKVTLMVSPDGEMNVIGGDREDGDGDQPYVGFERIKAQRGETRAQLTAENERLLEHNKKLLQFKWDVLGSPIETNADNAAAEA